MALPSARRSEEEQTRQRLFLDWGFDASQDEPVPHLKTIQQAVWEDRLLWLRYRSLFSWWIEPLEQVAAPYGLVAWAGNWYLVCNWEGTNHVVRLNLIEAVEIQSAGFARAPDFDLAGFWLDWRKQVEANRPIFTIRMRVAPQMLPFLRHFQAGPPDAQGWVTGTLSFETFEAGRARILSYGGAVQVLEPEALRMSIIDFAEQIQRIYQEKPI